MKGREPAFSSYALEIGWSIESRVGSGGDIRITFHRFYGFYPKSGHRFDIVIR